MPVVQLLLLLYTCSAECTLFSEVYYCIMLWFHCSGGDGDLDALRQLLVDQPNIPREEGRLKLSGETYMDKYITWNMYLKYVLEAYLDKKWLTL